ncbi:terminase, partial [Candidatus Pacearchaeota archaeon]|nr:terminase [Candidatus Pacearchaeota archaeon]
MNEQGEITCVVYAPDMVDSQGDSASAAVIKDFAYDFAKNGGNID